MCMKKISKRLASIIAGTVTVIGVGCIMSDTSVAAKVAVSGITVKAPYAKTISVAKGKKVTITPLVSVKPNKKANKKVVYKSLNKKVAAVSKKGVIKGLSVGSTKLVVTSVKDKTKSASVKVKVVKNAVTKLTLSKKNINAKPGDKFTLKAAVKPAKAGNKKLLWTSSDEKVAVVDNKGNVTVQAAGVAVIKAASTDGSNKSAKCNVTVEELTDLVTAKAMNENTIDLTLSKAEDIKVSDIKVYSKATYEGRFITEHAAAIVQSDDRIHYRLTLAKHESLLENSYVKVVINSLSGKKEFATKVIFPGDSIPLSDTVIVSETGSKETMTYVDFKGKIKGEPTYKVEGLPAGYTTITKNGLIYVCGKSDVVLDNIVGKISAEDEFGNKATVNIRFLVGNAAAIVNYIEPITVMANKTGKYYSRVYTAGGSGELEFDITNSNDIESKYPGIKVKKYSDEYIEFENEYVSNVSTGKKVPAVFAPGTYSFGITILDKKNANLKKETSLTVVSKPLVTITGILKDAAGQPVANQMVYADCTSMNIYNTYSINSIYTYNRILSNTETDSTGKYTIDVFDGQTYTVSGCGAYAWNVTAQAGGANVDLTSPYYKVSFSFPVENAAKVFGSVKNYDVNNEVIHEYTISELTDINDKFPDNTYSIINGNGYFLPGQYHLKTDNSVSSVLNAYSANGTWMGKYIAEAVFEVGNADISVTSTMTKTDYPDNMQNVH